MGLPLSLAVCLLSTLTAQVPQPEEESSPAGTWEMEIADRIAALPNPYEFYDSPPPETLLKVDEPWDAVPPTPSRERRWFEMEDSADWLGLTLGQWVTAGLQVEFVGPAEEPKRERKMTNLKWDPFHPVYVQTTVGLRIRF